MATSILKLPFITESQSSKHITHNEALRMLDVFASGQLLDIYDPTPPGSPGDGDAYFVPGGATGDWSSHIGKIAQWSNSQWYYFDAPEGWTCFVVGQNRYFKRTSTDWESVLPLPIFSTSSLPAPANYYGCTVFVTDGDGGDPCLAACDGGAWKRISLGAAVSAS